MGTVVRLDDHVIVAEGVASNAFVDAERRSAERMAFANRMVGAWRKIQRMAAGTEDRPFTATDLDGLEQAALQELARSQSDHVEAIRHLAALRHASDQADAIAAPGHGAAA